jgi:putative nucleotidyltransferase with HDIG domain
MPSLHIVPVLSGRVEAADEAGGDQGLQHQPHYRRMHCSERSMTGQVASPDALVGAARAAERTGDWDQALTHYEAAFARLGREGDARLCANLLRWIGTVHRQRGDHVLASELYEASLAVAELNALDDATAHALNCQAIVEQYRGHLDVAEELYLRARSLAEAVQDERLAAMVHQNLGTMANIRGELTLALERYEEALYHARRLGDSATVVHALNNLGMAHVDLEQWGLAERRYEEALSLARSEADAGLLALIELNRAELYLRCRQLDRARECCDLAFEIYSRSGSLYGQAEAHKFYGVMYRETSKPSLAATHLELAVQMAQRCDDRLLEAEAEAEWALVHLGAGRNPEALQCLNRSHRLFSQIQARRDIADIDQRLDGLEATFLRVVRTWAESIEAKDRYTAGHCQRVADFACMLAEAIGIQGRELTWFRMGAFLHDVGKIVVPDKILNKPGKLNSEEWSLIQRHTVVGDAIISSLDFPFDIRPMVRSHHEQWTGTGYPDRLAGEAIPLHARILCVADAFDALTSARSYRPAIPRTEALQIMESDAGHVFDPDLFAIFRTLVEQSGEPETPPPPAAG